MRKPLYEQLVDQILAHIKNGVLKEGYRIPSLRRLSQDLNVSISTVKRAYWQLEAQNYIEAIPQSGFYVKKLSAPMFVQPYLDPSQLDTQKFSLSQIYGIFQDCERVTPKVELFMSVPNRELLSTSKLRHIIAAIALEQKPYWNQYLTPPGSRSLREQISRISAYSEANLSPDEIIITNGSQEANFLAFSVICKPGDMVVFESPTHFRLLQMAEHMGLKITEIPSSPDEGMNLDVLRYILEHQVIRAVFSAPNFNNPLGFVMPSQKKRDLVDLLRDFNIPLIEDDVYGDLCFNERPNTCKSYDITGKVILTSSFSKTIASGLRIGWIAPGRYHQAVIEMKTLLNLSTSPLCQIIVSRFLKEGGYGRYLRNLKSQLNSQMLAMRASILKYFPGGTRVSNPSGGLVVWVELPPPVNTEKIYRQALKKNILIAPGYLFSMSEKYQNCMRLNFGTWNEEVESAIRSIGLLCENALKH